MVGSMKALIGLAVVLGLVGTVLGIIGLTDSSDAFDERTLALEGGSEERIDFKVPYDSASHPMHDGTEFNEPAEGFASVSELTGDRSGEWVRTCVPLVSDRIDCSGAFQLEDGTIEYDATDTFPASPADATAAIIGGTGSYAGATGEVDVDFATDTFTLRLLIPKG